MEALLIAIVTLTVLYIVARAIKSFYENSLEDYVPPSDPQYLAILSPLVQYARRYDSQLALVLETARASSDDEEPHETTAPQLICLDLMRLIRLLIDVEIDFAAHQAKLFQTYCKMVSLYPLNQRSLEEILPILARGPINKHLSATTLLENPDPIEMGEVADMYWVIANQIIGLDPDGRSLIPGGLERVAIELGRDLPEVAATDALNDHDEGGNLTPEYLSACAVIGVAPSHSDDELKSAYRSLARQWHPNRLDGMAPELLDQATKRMEKINIAYSVLKTQERPGAVSDSGTDATQ